MGTGTKFSKEFKDAIVKKVLNRGPKTIQEFCDDHNLKLSTVTRWISKCGSVAAMKNKKNGSVNPAEKIFKIVFETYSLNEEELGLYLRKNGLHSNQLAEWRSSFLDSVNKPKVNFLKKDDRDLKIKDLEKNLRKKDAALAEVSALLILQKKAHLLWPSPSEDEVI